MKEVGFKFIMKLYMFLLSFYVKVGKVIEVECLVWEIENFGVKFDIFMFNFFLSVYGNLGRWIIIISIFFWWFFFNV